MALFPTINIVISALVTAAEYGIREKKQAQSKADILIHTPLPKIKPFTRAEAVLFSVLAYTLQTVNGILAEYPQNKASKAFDDFYRNPLFTFYGQIILMLMVYAMAFKAAPVIGTVIADAACAATPHVNNFFSSVSAAFRKVTTTHENNETTPLNQNNPTVQSSV